MLNKYETGVLQDQWELEQFCSLIRDEGVTSYLEIGCKFGGSLWRAVRSMPKGCRATAVDLPHGDGSFKKSLLPLTQCVEGLNGLGYQVDLIIGDSTDPAIVRSVTARAPFGLVFIDADHDLYHVTHDWDHYGSLGHIVAFHDIAWQARPPPSNKTPIEVPILWKKLKENYRHVEFIAPGARDMGIGVLWRS